MKDKDGSEIAEEKVQNTVKTKPRASFNSAPTLVRGHRHRVITGNSTIPPKKLHEWPFLGLSVGLKLMCFQLENEPWLSTEFDGENTWVKLGYFRSAAQ